MKDKTNRHFWDRVSGIYNKTMDGSAQYEQMLRLIKKRLTPSMNVLELATGTGIIARNIAPCVKNVEATDFSHKMILEAKKLDVQNNVNYSVQDACELSFEANSFDAVIISNALHIMPNPKLALENIKRVLKNDGVLIAPTFVHEKNSFLGKLKTVIMSIAGFRTYYKWNCNSFCEFLNDNGFIIDKAELLKSAIPLCYVEAHINWR